jgi:hypothetical protein
MAFRKMLHAHRGELGDATERCRAEASVGKLAAWYLKVSMDSELKKQCGRQHKTRAVAPGAV